MRLTILALFIFMVIKSAYGQLQPGVDSIELTSTQAISGGQVLTMNNQFKLVGNDRIEWSQNEGAEITTYIISNLQGAWQDLSTEGQIEFQVMLGTRSGSIFLYRNNNEPLTLRIQMVRGTVNLVPFEFIISETSAIE